MPDSSSAALNPTEILRHLNCGDFLVVHQETKGADTKIWKVMVNMGYAALRVFRPEQTEQFKFELQAMTLASAAGIPVPEVLMTGLYRGNPVMLTTWIEGESLLDACDSPEAISKLGKSFGRLHRRLHENTTRQDDSCLLHLDYHPLNVLVEQGKIASVLDWTNSEWGSPSKDVARTVSLLICTPLIDRSDRKFARTLRRIARAYLAGYGPTEDLIPFIREATVSMEHELDFHINERGLSEPNNSRRILAKWLAFNQ